MLVNAQGWLEREWEKDPPLAIYPTWKRYDHLDTDDGEPDGIVWHYTAFTGVDLEELCMRQQRDYPNASAAQASWHLAIARDGRVFQIASCLEGTWHVGGTTNRTKIGVELENVGRLKQLGGAWHCWPYYRSNNQGKPDPKLGPHPRYRIPDEQVRSAPGEGVFQDYTEEQVRSAGIVLGALVEAYRFDREACTWGHADLADLSSREDPGPLWGCRRWPGIYLPRVLDGVFAPGDEVIS
jgi:N-acetyl-anhydromuramyl-L-alanine amidase AmpD